MFALTQQRGGHGKHVLSFKCLNGNASGNAAVKGNVNHIIGGNGYRGGNCFRDSICCNRRPSSLHSFGELHHFERPRSEEHTSELQSLMRISYAVFCLKKHTDKH